jgi:hypothetical protein
MSFSPQLPGRKRLHSVDEGRLRPLRYESIDQGLSQELPGRDFLIPLTQPHKPSLSRTMRLLRTLLSTTVKTLTPRVVRRGSAGARQEVCATFADRALRRNGQLNDVALGNRRSAGEWLHHLGHPALCDGGLRQ